jgi:hypothetical protein
MPKKIPNSKKSHSTAKISIGKTALQQTILFSKKYPFVVGAIAALIIIPVGWFATHASSLEAAFAPFGLHVGKKSMSDTSVSSGKNNDKSVQQDSNKKSSSTANTKDNKSDNSKKNDPKKANTGSMTGTSNSTTAGAATPAAPAAPAPPVPAPSQPALSPTGLHENIKTTIFWVGEAPGPDNANISNAESAWDGNWQTHFGGFDDPDHRNGYNPAAFTPTENPFYFALPYNDLDAAGHRKSSASNCPNAGASISWCKNGWIKITKGSKVAYAQWEDVGPLKEDDTAYVFGMAAPANTWGAKAGLDVSPAVRDYLGLADVDKTTWTFVSASQVPAGPWKTVVTTSPGGW